jgi:hypothetical protein
MVYKPRARDSQRKRVYEWERATVKLFDECWPRMDIHAMRDFVHQLWLLYGEGMPPRVQDGRGLRSSAGRGNRWRISVKPCSRTKGVVLHELAHSITDYAYPRAAWHGPEFMRNYIMLLARHHDELGMTEQDLRRTAREYRLKIEPKCKAKRI